MQTNRTFTPEKCVSQTPFPFLAVTISNSSFNPARIPCPANIVRKMAQRYPSVPSKIAAIIIGNNGFTRPINFPIITTALRLVLSCFSSFVAMEYAFVLLKSFPKLLSLKLLSILLSKLLSKLLSYSTIRFSALLKSAKDSNFLWLSYKFA